MNYLVRLLWRVWTLCHLAGTVRPHTAAHPMAPTAGGPQRVRRRTRWAHLAYGVVLVLAIMVQLLLLWLIGEAIDLYIAAVELWAELARKHLELTL